MADTMQSPANTATPSGCRSANSLDRYTLFELLDDVQARSMLDLACARFVWSLRCGLVF